MTQTLWIPFCIENHISWNYMMTNHYIVFTKPGFKSLSIPNEDITIEKLMEHFN